MKSYIFLFFVFYSIIAVAQEGKDENLDIESSYTEEYGQIIAPHNTTRLWTSYQLLKERLNEETQKNIYNQERFDSLFHLFKRTERDYYISLMDKKNLEQDNKKQTNLDIENHNTIVNWIITDFDSLIDEEDFDTLKFVNKISNYIKNPERELTKEKNDTLFIEYSSMIKSKYFKRDSFQVRLAGKRTKIKQPYIIRRTDIKTTPYILSGRDEFRILGTTSGENEWNIYYMSTSTKNNFTAELHFTGYRIYGCKAEILVSEPKKVNIWNRFVMFIKSTEIIFVIFITALANINRIIEEVKSIIGKIKQKS